MRQHFTWLALIVLVALFCGFAHGTEPALNIDRVANGQELEVITVVSEGEVKPEQNRQKSSVEGSFRMAVRVHGMTAGGNLRIDGRQTLRIGDEIWYRRLTGEVRGDVVHRQRREVPVEEIANLRIHTLRVKSKKSTAK